MTTQAKINAALLEALIELRAYIANAEPKYLKDFRVSSHNAGVAIDKARRLMEGEKR